MLGAKIEGQLIEAVEISRAVRVLLTQFPYIGDDRFQAIASALRQDREHILNIAVAPKMVVRYVHPIEGNEAVIGFDVRSRPDQWDAAKPAATVNRPVVAGPVALVQGGFGFIIRAPILFEGKRGPENLLGLISVVISTRPLSDL